MPKRNRPFTHQIQCESCGIFLLLRQPRGGMWRLPRKPITHVAANRLRLHLYADHGIKISKSGLAEILPPVELIGVTTSEDSQEKR